MGVVTSSLYTAIAENCPAVVMVRVPQRTPAGSRASMMSPIASGAPRKVVPPVESKTKMDSLVGVTPRDAIGADSTGG